MSDIDRSILDLPRDFRLIQEGKNNSVFSGVTYGLDDDLDRTLKYWNGMFFFSTGQCIAFNFVVPEDYPNSPPVLTFSDDYRGMTSENYDDEMGTYVANIHSVVKVAEDGALRIPSDLVSWDRRTFLGQWLTNIKRIIFKL